MKQKLPREILSIVNRRAHAAGIVFAEQEKKRLVTELERMVVNKTPLPELKIYLDEQG